MFEFAVVPWSRLFDDPIKPPKGKPIVNTGRGCGVHFEAAGDAATKPEWQAAGEAVIMAAEDRGPLMHAHVGMMLALHGAKPIQEAPASKTHWGRRKLARDN